MRASDASDEPKRRWAWPVAVGSVCVAGLIALWWSAGRDDGAAPVAASSLEAEAAGSLEAAHSSTRSRPADLGRTPQPVALPESLRGTDVDGGLTIDADGVFVPTPDAIALFDYFLAASGEESADAIHARIVAEIRSRLEGEAALAAEALLAVYLGFRDELRELALGSEAPRDLEQRLQWVRELRRKHFGAAVAESLFGESEDVARIDLERRRVALDPGLEPAERHERLAALDEQLPESVRSVRESSRRPQRVHDEVEALRGVGGSDAEVYALREREFGAEAAGRLARLDAERAAWQQRLESYRAERDRLLASDEFMGLSADEGEAVLDRLRREHFEEGELARVRALDRFGS